MKKIILTVILLFGILTLANAAISISTDHRSVFFGVMQLGEEKELANLGGYHNVVSCSSTNGNTWYLKINLLRPLSSGQDAIPLENFQWKLSTTNGIGMISNPYQFKPFSLFPDSVYISGPGESGGNQINFKFKYYLEIPEAQTSGSYNTTIRFTLTEIF